MAGIIKILFVEDVVTDAELIWHEIGKSDIEYSRELVDNQKDYERTLKESCPDIIISDYSLPQFDGMSALSLRNAICPLTPFILVTGSINEEVAVECMKSGADDYILKDNLSRLRPAIVNSINKLKLTRDKKAAEEELFRSEQRLQKAQAIAHVGNWELNLSTRMMWCSDEAKKIYGLVTEDHEISYELIKKNPLPEFRPLLDETLNRLLKYNEPYEAEFKIVRSGDGAQRSVYSKAELVMEPESDQVKVVGVIQDITERKMADESLLFNNLLLRTQQETSLDGILIVDENDNILNFNQRFIDIWSIPKDILESGSDEPVLQFNINQTANPEEFKKIVKHLYKHRDEISSDEFELKDGRTLDRYSSPVFSPDKKYYGRVWYFRDITDRKWAEDTIRESEKKYRNIFENVLDLYYETLIDGTILDISPSVMSFSKGLITREELLGCSIYDFYINDADRQSLISLLEVKGSVTDYEITLKNRDGSLIPCSISSKISLDPEGKPEKIIGSVRDITERKKAEEAISQERRMLRTLIDNIPDSIYVHDKDCRKVISNKADVEIIGLSNEAEVLGKTDIELFPGIIGQRGYAEDKKVIVSGEPVFNLEEEFIDGTGIKRWLQSTKIPLHDKDGNVTGLVGIGHDITDRKRVEAELQQSYMFSQSLLSTIPFGMDIVDEEGTILFQSDNFIRLFGDKTIGSKCWELYRDDKKQCSECPLRKGINIGETDAYETHGVLGNRIFEINHTGMMYLGKKAMLEIFQDITERKENEVELIRAKEKAEESDKLKTAFLHNISHEIRTPMNAIVGFSALLGEPDVDDLSRKSYIDVIMQSSNHLLSIITDIVDISNIEANLIKTVKNEINLNSIIESLCQQFLPKASEKKIVLDCETLLSDSDAFILADRTKLTQILSNLISNALKFTDKGYIKVSYRIKDKFLEFSVSDTGIGILPEYYARIFDRFYQVQNSVTRLYEGTGLGLAISKAYVELLGGQISLTSEPGKGTTFSFTIPYEKHVVETIPSHERKAPGTYVFPKKKLILVAEDIESNFKLIKYFLSGSNAEVVHASNGKEAVDKCFSISNIDLILMDIKMPVMDGYSAVRLIREKNTEIPIIAQTAYADDRDKAIECGCSGFISKPFDKKSLFKVLSEFI